MSYQSVEEERSRGRIAAANIDANARMNIANTQAGVSLSNAATQADTSRYNADQGLEGIRYGADSRLREAGVPRETFVTYRNEGTFVPDQTPSGLPPLDEDSTRARGGPVLRNAPYLVGEKGPELMVPDQNGTIIPNHSLRRVMAVPRAQGGRVQAGGVPYTEGYDSQGNPGRWYSAEGFRALQAQQQLEQKLRAEKELIAEKAWYDNAAKLRAMDMFDQRGWIPPGVTKDTAKSPEQAANDSWFTMHKPNVDAVIQQYADSGNPLAPETQAALKEGFMTKNPEIKKAFGTAFNNYSAMQRQKPGVLRQVAGEVGDFVTAIPQALWYGGKALAKGYDEALGQPWQNNDTSNQPTSLRQVKP